MAHDCLLRSVPAAFTELCQRSWCLRVLQHARSQVSDLVLPLRVISLYAMMILEAYNGIFFVV